MRRYCNHTAYCTAVHTALLLTALQLHTAYYTLHTASTLHCNEKILQSHCTLHFCSLRTAHCTAAQCTLLTAYCTLHTALECTLQSHSTYGHCRLHTGQCTSITAHCTPLCIAMRRYCNHTPLLLTAHCTLNTKNCSLHTEHGTALVDIAHQNLN